MEDMNITPEDYKAYFFLQVKMRHKAIEVCNDILREILECDELFDPDKDIIEFILDKSPCLDEEGEVEMAEYGIPSVQFKKYNKEKKYHELYIDFPVTWLRDDIDHVDVAKNLKLTDDLATERYQEYTDRLDERIKREEISMKLKGDIDPSINEESHSDKFIEISEIVEKELKLMVKFNDLPESDFTKGLKEFIKDFGGQGDII